MRDVAVLMACWKSPELLKVSVPSILKTLKLNSELIIILNEPDKESIDFLSTQNVVVIHNPVNEGPSAVDRAIPYIKSQGFKYVANVNSDMLFSDGWDKELVDLLEANKPCTVSCCLVEPLHSAHAVYESLDFYNSESHDIFNTNLKNGKYKTEVSVSYNHPILCSFDDFISVNGYSDNMEGIWVYLKGRGLDDDFVYRLYKKHNGNIKFLKSDKAYVYHGVSLNSNKLDFRMSGQDAFIQKNGLNFMQFRKMINYLF